MKLHNNDFAHENCYAINALAFVICMPSETPYEKDKFPYMATHEERLSQIFFSYLFPFLPLSRRDGTVRSRVMQSLLTAHEAEENLSEINDDIVLKCESDWAFPIFT